MKRRKGDLPYAMKQINAFATCATRLYGVVTIKELQDIMKKWLPASYPDIGEIKQVLKELAKDPEEVLYCLKGDRVCHFEFSTMTQKEVEEFREGVSETPRWMPDNLIFRRSYRFNFLLLIRHALLRKRFAALTLQTSSRILHTALKKNSVRNNLPSITSD